MDFLNRFLLHLELGLGAFLLTSWTRMEVALDPWLLGGPF